MRCAAPRPQSNSSFFSPASTKILGPNRSIRGCGEPVPRSVTLRFWPDAATESTANKINEIEHARDERMSEILIREESSPDLSSPQRVQVGVTSLLRSLTLARPTSGRKLLKTRLRPIAYQQKGSKIVF